MIHKTYHTVETILKSERKITVTDSNSISLTHIYTRPLMFLDLYNNVKCVPVQKRLKIPK